MELLKAIGPFKILAIINYYYTDFSDLNTFVLIKLNIFIIYSAREYSIQDIEFIQRLILNISSI